MQFYYMEDDGGQYLVSPVDREIKESLRKVVHYLEKAHKVKATKLHIKKMKKSLAYWLANMACEESNDFAYELSNRNGQINVCWELMKWTFFMSNHTLIALLTAAFERFQMKIRSEEQVKLVQESRELYQEFRVI